MTSEKITVSIETDSVTMLKIKRFLAWLDLNSAWGHSDTVAMDLDGDGSSKVRVTGIDVSEMCLYVDALSHRPMTMRVEYINAEDTP